MTSKGRKRSPGGSRRRSAPDLHDEVPTRFEVSGGVGEAGDLIVLRGQVHDRVEQQVDEPKGSLDPFGGEVADGATRSEPGLARRRSTIAVDRSIPVTATPRSLSGERDPSGADAELECGAVAGKRGEEVDGLADDRWVEHVGAPLLVARDRLVEVVHSHHHHPRATSARRPTGYRPAANRPIWSPTVSISRGRGL